MTSDFIRLRRPDTWYSPRANTLIEITGRTVRVFQPAKPIVGTFIRFPEDRRLLDGATFGNSQVAYTRALEYMETGVLRYAVGRPTKSKGEPNAAD